MHTPRNYQPLRDEQARAPHDDAPQKEQPKVTQEEPQPARPSQSRTSSPGWTDSGSMEAQQSSAAAYHNWASASVSKQREGRPDMPDNTAGQKSDKAQLAADLKEARESTSAPAPGRDQSQAPAADKSASQPDASASRDGAGKTALAADLKEAKENNTHAQEQGRDQSRSR